MEGREKVTGTARYAYEYEQDRTAYAAILQSTIAKGEVRSLDAAPALALPGVLEVVWHENAPRLESEGELAVLQSRRVAYRGQIVAAVIAEDLETARQAERLLVVDYAEEPHDVELRDDHPGLYKPEKVNPAFPTDTEQGDFDQAFAAAEVTVDATYETPWVNNNPMEPHATVAVWSADGHLTLYDSTQGRARRRARWPAFSGSTRRRSAWSRLTSAAASARRGRRAPTWSLPPSRRRSPGVR